MRPIIKPKINYYPSFTYLSDRIFDSLLTYYEESIYCSYRSFYHAGCL
jgi:hypothetical protein